MKYNNRPFFKTKKYAILNLLLTVGFCFGCKTENKNETEKSVENASKISYQDDVDFLKNHTQIIELVSRDNKSKVALSPALQGRVMTSSAAGNSGNSYGWINRALFKSKDTLDHINAYGGEERFWLGPEGGQYSIFFKEGDDFNLQNWQTPRLLDLDAFQVASSAKDKVTFTKEATLTNYSGFQFDIAIEREIAVLSKEEISSQLGVDGINGLNTVAYSTKNTLTNTGKENWEKESGLLSIWLLGMFNHSPTTTIIVPFVEGEASELGQIVNDTYFGKVPADRLVVKQNVIFFKGDGEFRSKIGLSPKRAKDILGSFDAKNSVLTIVKYNKPEGVSDYVNSMWEIQESPYAGDTVNSYNDGEPAPGEKPLGPFYELETSSPALQLQANASATHTQITFHIQGNETKINTITEKLFGVSMDEIKNAFNQ